MTNIDYQKLFTGLRDALMKEFTKAPDDVRKMGCFLRHEKRIKGAI